MMYWWRTATAQALQRTGEELQIPASLGGGYSMDWEPVVDGVFLPTNPVTEESFAEAGADIPLLIGSNLNEWSGFFETDQNGAPVYAYVFTYGNSYHGAEIPYVFHNVTGSGQEQTLAEQISQAWVNFARTGTPGAEGLPEWEAYTRESGATMLLDVEPALAYHHDQKLMEILAPDYEY